MSRRGSNIFGSIFKSIVETTAGRIQWHRNMWALVGGKWDRRRIRNKQMIGSSRVNEQGEFVAEGRVLVAKPHARCPQAPEDGFYFDGKWWWVPAVVCRKCSFHRESGRRFRYPRCTFRAPEDGREVASAALATIGGMMQRATAEAESMIASSPADRRGPGGAE